MFELNFKDERYLPFEGCGATGSWRLELPKDVRQFNYNTISDVILHVIYVLLGLYGWWKWTHGRGERGTLPVTRTGAAVAFMWTAVGVAATIGIGAAMRRFTNADRPFWTPPSSRSV